jgi:PAS domain S-box-containing protein
MTIESMASELRKTGISILGDVRWGTHFCYFYETKEDLLETQVLYFKAGLESQEFCVWVISPVLSVEEVKDALGQAVPDLHRHLAEGNLEIHSHQEWYLDEGRYNPPRVLQSWRDKLNQALARGHAGMRASGDTAWIQKKDRESFREYEKTLDELIADQRGIILCTYALTRSSGGQIFDVVHNHQAAVARRHGIWEVLETPELKQAKAEIKRLNEELEQRVIERTSELAKINEQLRGEVTERRVAENALRESETRFRRLLASNITGVIFWTLPGDIVDANDLFLNMVGYTREDLRQGKLSWKNLTPPEYAPVDEKAIAELVATGTCAPFEKEYLRKDGSRVSVLLGSALLEPQKDAGSSFVVDMTERKKVEEKLERYTHLLQTLSRRLFEVQEEERRHLARELHDEIGQALTAAKIILQSVTGHGDSATVARVQETTAILDRLLGQVRQISLDLRPSMLDDLGLLPALRSLVDQQGRRASVEMRFSTENVTESLDATIQTTCFRIAQEAITNALRHAHPTHVEVDLRREDENLRLVIRDNGTGFDAEAAAQVQPVGLGLIGISERAALVGGRAKIISSPNKGTTVEVSLPLTFSTAGPRRPKGK